MRNLNLPPLTRAARLALFMLIAVLPCASAQQPSTKQSTTAKAPVKLSVALDPTFGSGGCVADHIDATGQTTDLFRFVAVDRQGRPVAAGNTSGHRFAVGRYTRGGAPDTSFAGKGKTAVCIEDEASIAASPVQNEIQFTHGMTIDPKGRIVVVGKGAGAGGDRIWDFALLRFLEDGQLDKTFSGVGYQKYQAHESRNIGLAVVVAADCSIVTVGYATTPTGTEPLLIRFRENGDVDEAITAAANGSLGQLLKKETPAIATGIAIDKAGRHLVGMNIQKGDRMQWSVARLMPDGSVDGKFGDGGLWSATLDPVAINEATSSTVVDASGRVVLGGYSEEGTGLRRLTVARLDDRGRLDSTFGADAKGFIILDGYGANVTYRYGPRASVASGRIALTGAITGPGGKSTSFGLAVMDESGNSVAKIAARGLSGSRADQPWAVAFDGEDRVVVGGGSQGPNGKWRFALARYTIK